MQLRRRYGTYLLLALGAALLCVDRAGACSTPVFCQALETWMPDSFEAFVFHRGPLSAEQIAAVRRLERSPHDADRPVNLAVAAVDVDTPLPGEVMGIWEAAGRPALPCVVLRYPFQAADGAVVWSGPLTDDAVGKLLDSPARQQIARRLLEGQAAVWVILDGGNAAANKSVESRLQEQLAGMETELKPLLPVENLDLAFSTVRVSRADPVEDVVVNTLLRCDPTLTELRDEPIVFPVIGRGRVLCALFGQSFNDEAVRNVGEFAAGPCSCLVKAENPGFDLFMGARWDMWPGLDLPEDSAPLPLVSVADAAAVETNPSRAGADTDALSRSERAQKAGALVRSVLVVCVGLVLLVTAAAVVLWRGRAHRLGPTSGSGKRR